MSKAVVKNKVAAKLDTVSNLKPVADRINEEYANYKGLEKEATESMLKIGLMLEFAKENLPHGRLMKWAESNLTITYRHASHFRKLAQFFIKANQLEEGEAFALVNPENSKKALMNKLQQMAFDFLGDKTQAELFAEYGIQVRDPKKKGGYHPGTPLELPPEETREHYDALQFMGRIHHDIYRFMIERTSRQIQHLNLPEIKALHDCVVQAKKELEKLITAG